MKISDQLKEEILSVAGQNIVSLIGEEVSLVKAGSVYKACCPLHGEKTPSFTVDPARKTFRCFGCNKGGDAARFFMELNGWNFPKALEHLAEKCGIQLESETKEQKERKAMLLVLSKAEAFFAETLHGNANGAKEYVDSRLTAEQVNDFRIGYTPSSGRALVDYLDKEKLPLWAAEKAGLLRKEEGKPYQDVFWGRVMFPIRNAAGYTVGFAGRTISPDAKPKYINCPETSLYKKSSALYGIDLAKDAIRETGEAFVVEGYLDLIQMFTAGIKNVVATCGTAFTKEHAKVLQQHGAIRLNLLFDGDKAGIAAIQKGVLLALEAEMACTAYTLPEGQDPDDYFKAGGTLESIKSMSGLEFLHTTGAEMSKTLKDLYRLERLEKGLVFMAKMVPDVSKILAHRGRFEELFSPETIPQIQQAIDYHHN